MRGFRIVPYRLATGTRVITLILPGIPGRNPISPPTQDFCRRARGTKNTPRAYVSKTSPDTGPRRESRISLSPPIVPATRTDQFDPEATRRLRLSRSPLEEGGKRYSACAGSREKTAEAVPVDFR